MEKSFRTELNKAGRLWLFQNYKEILLRENLVVLVAKPHRFCVKNKSGSHYYDRWLWNMEVHGKPRENCVEYALIQKEANGEVLGLYVIPHMEALRRKNAVLYRPRDKEQQGRASWLEKYRVKTEV